MINRKNNKKIKLKVAQMETNKEQVNEINYFHSCPFTKLTVDTTRKNYVHAIKKSLHDLQYMYINHKRLCHHCPPWRFHYASPLHHRLPPLPPPYQGCP